MPAWHAPLPPPLARPAATQVMEGRSRSDPAATHATAKFMQEHRAAVYFIQHRPIPHMGRLSSLT
jgi:hypothetical protein